MIHQVSGKEVITPGNIILTSVFCFKQMAGPMLLSYLIDSQAVLNSDATTNGYRKGTSEVFSTR